MKDEFDNECPYDFKNIQFMIGAKSNAGTKSNVYYYTFSLATGTNDATVTDHSLNGGYCHGNSFKEYINSNKRSLNFIVCRNTSATSNCYRNSAGVNCYNIACGNYCYGWTCGVSFPFVGGFAGELYSFRLYNRQLSDAEMKANADNDRLRFDL